MASFFSNLFGGGATSEAANRNRGEIRNYQNNTFGALDTGLNSATNAVTTGANNANNTLSRNQGLYSDLWTAGNNILDRGRDESLTALQNASAAYDPVAALGAEYGRGRSLYQDSLGINGAEGNARAQANFNAGPGYEFTRDQGLEALNRRRAAAGMLNSGNADIDALRFGTGLANQTYGSWQDRLAGFINPELQATSGAAAGRANAASRASDVISADALARLGLDQNVVAGQAGTNTQLAANDVALGNTLAGLNTNDANNRVGVYGNVLSGNTSANNMQAQGEASGARNLLGLGMGVANLAVGGMGGGSFGGLGGLGGLGNSSRTSTFGFNPLEGAFSFGGR